MVAEWVKMKKKSSRSRERAALYADCRDEPELPQEFNTACKDTESPVPVGDALKKLARWWIKMDPSARALFYFQGFEAMLAAGLTPSGEDAREPQWIVTLRNVIHGMVQQEVLLAMSNQTLLTEIERLRAESRGPVELDESAGQSNVDSVVDSEKAG